MLFLRCQSPDGQLALGLRRNDTLRFRSNSVGAIAPFLSEGAVLAELASQTIAARRAATGLVSRGLLQRALASRPGIFRAKQQTEHRTEP